MFKFLKRNQQLENLQLLNYSAALLHGIQTAAVLLLASESTREISASYLKFNPLTESLQPAARVIFDFSLAPLVALFFALSAVAHLYIATVGFERYKKGLKNGINKARWYEYSLSASVMIVLIAILSGIFDAGTLLALFALTAVMNLMGLMMEVHNQTTKKTSWLSFNIGVLAGIVPWIVIVIALAAGESAANTEIPTFVYWIFVSLFAFFNLFAVNMYLQYKKIGPWKDYLFGERAYIILSLVAKSLLAWQVYAGTLQPV